jgi:hypothetical protein
LELSLELLVPAKFQNSRKALLKMTSIPELEPAKLLIYKGMRAKNSKIPRFQQKCVRFPFGEFLGMKVLRQVLKKAAQKIHLRNFLYS